MGAEGEDRLATGIRGEHPDRGEQVLDGLVEMVLPAKVAAKRGLA